MEDNPQRMARVPEGGSADGGDTQSLSGGVRTDAAFPVLGAFYPHWLEWEIRANGPRSIEEIYAIYADYEAGEVSFALRSLLDEGRLAEADGRYFAC